MLKAEARATKSGSKSWAPCARGLQSCSSRTHCEHIYGLRHPRLRRVGVSVAPHRRRHCGVEPVGLGVASGVGCGGVRRWRRCPAAAAVAAATAAATTAVELAAGRGIGGGNGGGWLARCHQTADSLLWYSLRYGRASKGAAGGGGRRGGAPVCGAPEQERPASGSGGSSQQPARRHRRKKT